MFEGERPHFTSSARTYKFTTGEQVYLSRNGVKEGPYKIQEPKDGKYVLCDNSYKVIDGGKSFDEKDLSLYDPF